MGIIGELEQIIRGRKANPQANSYTCRLFDKGLEEIAKKVGEEAVEVVVAATRQDDQRLTEEVADLIYHLLVLLTERGVSWSAVKAELRKRHKKQAGNK